MKDVVSFLVGVFLLGLWAYTGSRWCVFAAVPNLMFGFRGMLRDA